MNDDINTLAWAMVKDDFDALIARDAPTRQRNRDCTPADQQSGVYNNHEGAEL